ncbi:MAG: EF-hand domain-containing protein [Candidatus Poseidoniaceae archaeon]|nr:EF-hand domain-containing protein [Candidatus Poseidoniaceae archaeon]
MTETENDETSMAECGNCRAVIPSDSSECSECKIKFSGLSEDALGECGACGTLVPLESTSCKKCGVIFVADDVMDVLRNWLANTGLSIASLFDKFDTNGDGMIDSDELRQGLLSLNLADLPPSQIDRLIEQIDIDGDGKIDLAELEKSVTGAEYTPSEVEKEEDSEESEEENEEEEDSDADSEDSEEENEEEDSDADSEDDSESASKQYNPAEILEMLINVMDEQEANPAEIFHVLDEDGDKYVSSEEFSNTVGELLEGEDISQTSISDFIESLDLDKDGNIDIIEFISAIESQEDEELEEESEEDSNYSEKPPKEFPSPMQSAMITKKWNDIWWPLIHAAFFAFILIWVVNGIGLIVDGSGGPVALETSYGMGSGDLSEGDIYPCDAEIQVDNCANSLTPFSGEASSMPKGFYADGIFFIILGAMGMVGSMFTHLVLAKGWRERVKAMKEVESDTEDAKEASDDEDEGDSDSDEEENDDSVSDEDISEDEGDDSDDEEGDDSDDEEDDIDVGSHIGLTVDEEEFFGTIIEFDDEDELVTIKEDGTGDEITGYQDEMFLE